MLSSPSRPRVVFVRDSDGGLDDRLELLLAEYRQRTGVRLSKSSAVKRLLTVALASPRMLRLAGLQ